MEPLHLEGTDFTPDVRLDRNKGILLISGRSLIGNANEHYKPVLTWINEYAKQADVPAEFMFSMEYFNTESEKVFLEIFSILATVQGIKIIWHYPAGNHDVLHAGQVLAELVDIPFEFKSH